MKKVTMKTTFQLTLEAGARMAWLVLFFSSSICASGQEQEQEQDEAGSAENAAASHGSGVEHAPGQAVSEPSEEARSARELALHLAEPFRQSGRTGRSSAQATECLKELVALYLEEGRVELARELAETLPKFERWTALAKVARYQAVNGDREAANALIEVVKAGSSAYGGVWRDWIDTEVAVALAGAGRSDEAFDLVSSIVDDARREYAQAVVTVETLGGGQDVAMSVKVDDIGVPKGFSPEYLRAAERLVGVVGNLLGREEAEAREAAIGFGARLADYADNTRGNAALFYLKLAEVYQEHGEPEMMEEMVTRGFKHFTAISPYLLEYYEVLARLSAMADQAGRRDVALRLVEEAPARVEVLADHLKAEAMAQIGLARMSLGMREEARAAFDRAMEYAVECPNPNAGRLGAFRAALLMAEAGFTPSESYTEVLKDYP